MSEDNTAIPGGFAPGSQLAGYRLDRQLGQGGMAVVFRARDERLGRQVALKILSPALAADQAFRQRFIGESRAAAAVDDPHIIPVFEAGEAGGVLFIAMRYVPDGDVRTLLDRLGPLPPARAVDIAGQVASALDNAHAHGLVHRDVKPANILLGSVATDSDPDHVYLSDFGLSKTALSSTGLTATGQFLGTLDYVAPEQIEGRPADGAADQYALACTAFELLSGLPPFRRDLGLGVIYAQLSEPPPALTSRRPGLPPGIDAVFARAMAKAPQDRYASCREFAVALRDSLGLASHSGPGHTVAASRPPGGSATETTSPGSDILSYPPGQPAQPPAGSYPPGQPAQPPAGSYPPAQPPAGSYPPGGSYPADSRPGADPPTQAAISGGGRYTRPGTTDPLYAPATPTGEMPVRRRSRALLITAAVVVAVLIIGGGAYALLGRGGGAGTSAAAVLPGHVTTAATAPLAHGVRSRSLTVGGQPFFVQPGGGGQFSYVGLSSPSMAMLSNNTGLGIALHRTISLPGPALGEAYANLGGKGYVLAASRGGAIVVSTREAKTSGSPVAGQLTSPGSSAQEVAVSPDSRFAFVTLKEPGKPHGQLAVFNLQSALASRFTKGLVGLISVGGQPVGMAQSGQWLYVANMGARDIGPGTVSVLNLTSAEAASPKSVVATVQAGYNPSRVMVSADGGTVWVTTQQSNALLAFSAAKMRTDSAHALQAVVPVGANPIGETFIKGGSEIVVADSAKSHQPGTRPDLMVVNTSKALAGDKKNALAGRISTGTEPRDFATVKGTLLVADTGSGQVQAISIGSIP